MSPKSQNVIDRRSVFTAGVLLAGTAAAPALASQKSPAHDPRVKALEALIAELKAAITRELDLEGSPGHEAAREKADSLEKQLQAAADDMFAHQPSTITDLALRARLVEYWNERHSDFLTDQDRSASELVRAVLIMAGLEPVQAKGAVVRTIPALIAALGGRDAVADYAGVSVCHVVRWERQDSIPPGWHYRFAVRAKRRGFTLDDELFA